MLPNVMCYSFIIDKIFQVYPENVFKFIDVI